MKLSNVGKFMHMKNTEGLFLNTTTVTTFVKGVQRLENSLNGNPQYRIHTTNGTVDTPTDSQVAYEYDFDNFVSKNVVINYSLNEEGKAHLVSILELKEEK